MLVTSLAITLFLLMDPTGNMPVFITQLKGFSLKKQRNIVLHELLIALFVILLFMFLGGALLKLLDVDQHTVFISVGVILFIISLKMIFHSESKKNNLKHPREPLIVPLAIPLVAGPAILAAVMIYAAQVPTLYTLFWAILIAWLISTLILFFALAIAKPLEPRGIIACERLMGLILTLIAIQMLLNGIESFIASPPTPALFP